MLCQFICIIFLLSLFRFATSSSSKSNDEILDVLRSSLSKDKAMERIPPVASHIMNSKVVPEDITPPLASVMSITNDKPQGMHVDIRFKGAVHYNLFENSSSTCEESTKWCVKDIYGKCKVHALLFLIYLPRSIYIDPYELQYRHSFGYSNVRIHLNSFYSEHFSPEAFAEDSYSTWMAVELNAIDVDLTTCSIPFDLVLPVHLRYRARLLASHSSLTDGSKDIDGDDFDDVAKVVTDKVTDDDVTLRSPLRQLEAVQDAEEALVHSFFGHAYDKAYRISENTVEGKDMSATQRITTSSQERYRSPRQLWITDVMDGSYIMSIIPTPLVAIGTQAPTTVSSSTITGNDASDMTGDHHSADRGNSEKVVIVSSVDSKLLANADPSSPKFTKALVVSSEQCICKKDTPVDTMSACSNYFRRRDDSCSPSLTLLMPAALYSHVHIVLWGTIMTLLLTTYVLSWLLIHPKRGGGVVSLSNSNTTSLLSGNVTHHSSD